MCCVGGGGLSCVGGLCWWRWVVLCCVGGGGLSCVVLVEVGCLVLVGFVGGGGVGFVGGGGMCCVGHSFIYDVLLYKYDISRILFNFLLQIIVHTALGQINTY